MTWLALLLLFKISFTMIFVALPMLLLRASRIEARLAIDASAVPYIRLYGWALVALVAGYGGGIPPAEAGHMPWGVIAMGIVSNAGATLLMLSPWGTSPSRAMPLVFGSIAVGLVLCACFPQAALRHAF
jgi:hypothetical protein